MVDLHQGGYRHGVTEFNITPLADVCTVLILVFLVTMPDVLWKGIQVNPAQASSSAAAQVQRPESDENLLTVVVAQSGITIDRAPVALEDLADEIARRLDGHKDRTVVVVPTDNVALGRLVSVLDIAKASGASSLALLDGGEEKPL